MCLTYVKLDLAKTEIDATCMQKQEDYQIKLQNTLAFLNLHVFGRFCKKITQQTHTNSRLLAGWHGEEHYRSSFKVNLSLQKISIGRHI